MGGQNLLLRGIGASPGVRCGRAFVLNRGRVEVFPYFLPEEEVEEEVRRLRMALEEAKEGLRRSREEALRRGYREAVYLIDAHLQVLDDRLLLEESARLIRQERVDAAWALQTVLHRLRCTVQEAEDEYLRDRLRDVDQVGEVVLRRLVGHSAVDLSRLPEGSVLVAHDLSPAEAAQVDLHRVRALVTEVGGPTSHTAIVARALKVPAVLGLEGAAREIRTGDLLVVDGTGGLVIVNPTPEVLAEYQDRCQRFELNRQELLRWRDLPAETRDGHRVRIRANLHLAEDLSSVAEHGAEGIGLYRTEFLFLNRPTPPSEEEQFEVYRRVVEGVRPHPATVRILDLGGDKLMPGWAPEANPALGLRGVRLCLRHPELFRPQLRALLRASAFGRLRVLLPMVSCLEEVRDARRLLEELREELLREGVPVSEELELGVMVETPGAALIADLLAPEVDFFSIGTNDLIQYTLAIDRDNEHVSHLYDPLHPAVLRLMSHVVEAGHAVGIWVGICGEMAGDASCLPLLVGMDLDELSMNAMSVLPVKRALRELSYAEARRCLEQALRLSTPQEVRALLREVVPA